MQIPLESLPQAAILITRAHPVASIVDFNSHAAAAFPALIHNVPLQSVFPGWSGFDSLAAQQELNLSPHRLFRVTANPAGDLTLLQLYDITASRVRQRLLAGLGELQAKFLAEQPHQEAFADLLQFLLDVTGSEYGFVGEVLHDNGQPWLRTVAITNIAWDEHTLQHYERYRTKGLEFRNLDTLFGAAIRSGQPLITNSPAAHPSSHGIPHGHPPLNSFLALPLKLGEDMVGLLGIANRPGGYESHWIEWLEPFSRMSAGTIRAFQNLRQRRALEQEHSAYLNESTAVHVVSDFAGRLRRVNPYFSRLLGVSPEALSNSLFIQYLHPDDVANTLDAFNSLVAGNPINGLESRIRAADGVWRWLRWTIPPPTPGTDVVYATAVDITAEKQMSTELRLLALVAKRTNNLVVLTDADGFIEWVNDGFVRHTGYTLDEVRGKRPGSMLQGPETDLSSVALIREALRAGRGVKEQILNYTISGRKYWLDI